MDLVQMTPLRRKVKSLSRFDTLQKNNRVGDTALGADNQPLEIGVFLGIRITNGLIFIDREFQCPRHRTGPLYGSRDGSSISDVDDLVIALRENTNESRQNEHEADPSSAHTHPPFTDWSRGNLTVEDWPYIRLTPHMNPALPIRSASPV